MAALAQHFSPDNEVFKQVVLRSYGLHGRGNQVSPMTEAVLENMDPDDRSQFKDIDKTLKEQRQKQRRVEHALKRKRARCAQVRPKKKSRAAPDVAAPIVVAPVDVAAPIDAAPVDVVAQIDVAPVDAVAPIDVAPEPSEQPRRPLHHYLHWQTTECPDCRKPNGQFKYDPAPGLRDEPTWHMRVMTTEGVWPTKGHQYRRRHASVVGDSDAFAKQWILENNTCC